MVKRILSGVLICLSAASLCRAEDDYDIKVYPCVRVQEAIVIDGVLDENDWPRAPLVGGFTHYNRPELARVQTYLRACYGRDYLYIGVICDEPKMEKLTPVGQARDAHGVFSGEAIEIFIDPGHDHSKYYQFGINAAGSIYDSRGSDPTWSAKVLAATTLGEDQWALEFAVPWRDLETAPEPGGIVGLNVCRDRQIDQDREWSNWSQTKANFHDPERFASLVLAPTPAQLVALQGEFRKGGRTGPLRILSRHGIGAETYHDMAAGLLTRIETRLAELRSLRDAEEGAVRTALAEYLADFETRLAPLSARVSGSLDGGAFTRIELALTGMERELAGLIWEARLDALLSAI